MTETKGKENQTMTKFSDSSNSYEDQNTSAVFFN